MGNAGFRVIREALSGTGVIVFNGGAERGFIVKDGAFDGTFTEMVDETTPGNYIVFTGVTGSSFTTPELLT